MIIRLPRQTVGSWAIPSLLHPSTPANPNVQPTTSNRHLTQAYPPNPQTNPKRLLEASELSLADGLLDRCWDVAWTLHRCGIRLVDSIMTRAANLKAAEERVAAGGGWVAPEWVLDVRAVTEAQVGGWVNGGGEGGREAGRDCVSAVDSQWVD